MFNIGSTEEISIRALAERIIQTLGSKSEIQLVGYGDAYPAGFEDMLRRRPALAKLEAVIGFIPSTPLQAIIELTSAGFNSAKEC